MIKGEKKEEAYKGGNFICKPAALRAAGLLKVEMQLLRRQKRGKEEKQGME